MSDEEKTKLPSPTTFGEAMLVVQETIEQPKFDSNGQVGSRKYKYASLGACLKAVKDACNPIGMAVWFDIIPYGPIGEDSAVVTVVSFKDTEHRLFPVKFNYTSNMQDDGSALTYAKRYSICGAFALAAEEDTDGPKSAQSQKKGNPQASGKKGKFDRISALKTQALSLGISEQGIKDHIAATYQKDMKDFTNDEIASFEKYLTGLIADKKKLDSEKA